MPTFQPKYVAPLSGYVYIPPGLRVLIRTLKYNINNNREFINRFLLKNFKFNTHKTKSFLIESYELTIPIIYMLHKYILGYENKWFNGKKCFL